VLVLVLALVLAFDGLGACLVCIIGVGPAAFGFVIAGKIMGLSANLVFSLARFFRLYFRAWWDEVIGSRNDAREFRMTAKRAVVLVFLGWLLPSLIVWNHVGLFLDDVFFPKWKEQAVEKPVFIIGNARSGTTWTHRVLAQDTASFTSPCLWEIMFAQSVTWRVLFYRIGRFDMKFGRPLSRIAKWLDKILLGQLSLHPMSLWYVEEDEWLLLNIGTCQLAALLFPMVDSFHDLIHFDDALSKTDRGVIMGYYRECIQRHLYATVYITKQKHFAKTGRHITKKIKPPRYLAKNPVFTLRLKGIFEVFPDANVVVMVRDPSKAIPSMVSYISSWWAVFASPTTRYPNKKNLTDMCSLHYTYPVDFRRTEPAIANRICFMHYELCVADLTKSFSALYAFLGLNMTGGMAAILDHEAILAQRYTSAHEYNIQELCGQSEQEFIEKHRLVYELYPGYARRSRRKQSIPSF